jgi:hypothetical protein
LTIVHEVDPNRFVVAQTLTTQQGARTVALDNKTHKLYLPSASFGPATAASAGESHQKPPMLPGSFVVLVVAPGVVTN